LAERRRTWGREMRAAKMETREDAIFLDATKSGAKWGG
jgi:hypothetical protein